MLRPTQSAIIFVQQLGRGLRKHFGKEYLTVIDFIGNYSNNYLVPIALYGDRSYNKDTIRKMLNTGSSSIPGCSTVNFDRITKERIYRSIDQAQIRRFSDLKHDYQLLEYELGRAPMMMDFLDIGGREPYAFVDYSGSYYNFVKKADPDNADVLTKKEADLLEFYSKEILNGKRCEETVILAMLLEKESATRDEINNIMNNNYGFVIGEDTIVSAVRNLNGEFIKDAAARKYGITHNIDAASDIRMDGGHKEILKKSTLYKYLNDMIRYSFKRFKTDYDKTKYRNGFMLYKKYSRRDVCRILNWDRNEESTIYGYRIKHNTCPIFVTYNKKEDISESTKYEDAFVNPYIFSWMTRSRVRLDSNEAIDINNYKNSGLRISLFIKKSDAEGSDFYYMGDVTPQSSSQEEITGSGGIKLPIVNFKFAMHDEVEESMYNYLESSI